MAPTQDGSNSSSCFLGCFGVSGRKKAAAEHDEKGESGGRKKSRWLFWTQTVRTKKAGAKTVPVDSAVSEKTNRSREIHVVKVEKIVSETLVPDQAAAAHKSHKTRIEEANSIILQNNENLVKPEKDTCRKGSNYSRNREDKKGSGNRTVSPENLTSTKFSFPQSKKTRFSQGGQDEQRQGKERLAGKYDPVVGLSITMTTFMIVLLCGKLCAILFISAWFYFLPRLRTSGESNEKSKPGEIDLDSNEWKKKVLLEGFLERNHRNVAGVL